MNIRLLVFLFVTLTVAYAEEPEKKIKDVENEVKSIENNVDIEKAENSVDVQNGRDSKLSPEDANELIKRAYKLRLRHKRSPKRGRSRERYRVHRQDGYYDQAGYNWDGRSRGYSSRYYGGSSRGGRSRRRGGRSRGGHSRGGRSRYRYGRNSRGGRSRRRSRERYYDYGRYGGYDNGYYRRGYPYRGVIHIGYSGTGQGIETGCQCPFASDDPQQIGGPGYDREQDDSLEDLRRWHEAFAAHPCCRERWAVYWRSHDSQQPT